METLSDRKLVDLLRELIKIPSWVSGDEEKKKTQNENQLVDFLESWIKANTRFETVRQPLAYGRFNLIAKVGRPDIVFLAHTDTVAPSTDAPYDQFAAEIHDGKVWGRGACDMKSGIAAMLQAVALTPVLNNLWFFLYADEEYDFLGMKALVEEYGHLRPKLIVSSDGSNLSLGHGCRGLIEIRARVRGVSGHAAKGNGLNAIDGVSLAVAHIREFLNQGSGVSAVNLAYLLGGSQLPGSESFLATALVKVGQEGNVIPDVAEFVVDIRPASPEFTSREVVRELGRFLKNGGYGFELLNVRHDLGAWFTDLSEVADVVDLAIKTAGEKRIGDLAKTGYIDLQMLWDAVGRPPAFMFGGGVGETGHKPDEHIEIEDLIKTRDFFRSVLTEIPRI